jgi:hypothetical protein
LTLGFWWRLKGISKERTEQEERREPERCMERCNENAEVNDIAEVSVAANCVFPIAGFRWPHFQYDYRYPLFESVQSAQKRHFTFFYVRPIMDSID